MAQIKTPPATDAYRKGHDRIFKKKRILTMFRAPALEGSEEGPGEFGGKAVEGSDDSPLLYPDEIVINQSRSRECRNKKPFWRTHGQNQR